MVYGDYYKTLINTRFITVKRLEAVTSCLKYLYAIEIYQSLTFTQARICKENFN